MAMQPLYDGPTLVRVAVGAGSLASLGYTENGADVDLEPFWLDVHGDQQGGDAGPPIDVQYIGTTALIRLTMTSIDYDVLDTLRPFVAGVSLGQSGTPGTLMFTESNKTFRLLLSPTLRPMNFPRCIIRNPIAENKGVKFKRVTLDITAYQNGSSVVWNTTTN